jgi:hypothetical protein
MADFDTLLVLTGMGIPPYSARGLKQQLIPIAASANMRRTVNGALINLSPSQFQKFRTVITGNDQSPPANDGVWPGRLVTIDCIEELAYLTGGTPERPVVDGSSRVVGPWTFYRPRLSMMMTTPLDATIAEWEAGVAWTMEFEEV